VQQKPTIPQILVTSLFFLWALTSNLIPVLIPHLKKACQLSDTQSAFIDSAYWLAYFLVSIPAGMVMKKYGYKRGIIAGLLLAALGTFLFWPAASARTFSMFLAALFIVAAGMTFLETAANPFMTLLGPPETADRRLNFAQAFNGLGAFFAAAYLSKKILSGKEIPDIKAMSESQLSSILQQEADSVKIPYLIIGLVLLAVAVLFVFAKFPETKPSLNKSSKLDFSILRISHVRWGVIAQFFYVGAQVCISSFFIRYCQQTVGLSETEATTYLGFLLLGFMIGRYVGTLLMNYVKPSLLLAAYALINIVLLAYIVLVGGKASIYALVGVEFFMSIMFPTIFSLSLKNLDDKTETASALLVMSIVGGAILPVVMGRVSDAAGSIQTAYLVPLICFFVVLFFGVKTHKPL
jgi:MFS transporter, FHS family, L-fucose permease